MEKQKFEAVLTLLVLFFFRAGRYESMASQSLNTVQHV